MPADAESKFSKSNPIPTRFEESENAFLAEVKRITGISTSEVIRRSVRLLRRQGNDERRLAELLFSLGT